MLSLLVSLLIAVVVMGLFFWIVTLIPLPAPFSAVARVICAVILFVWALDIIGVFGHAWRVGL